jgi:hypothetical protein
MYPPWIKSTACPGYMTEVATHQRQWIVPSASTRNTMNSIAESSKAIANRVGFVPYSPFFGKFGLTRKYNER